MKLQFIHTRPGNTRLILIFAGWSTGAPLYSGIKKEEWDTAVVSGYSSLDFPREPLRQYTTIYLYCWSLGVWAASQTISPEDVTMAFAVGGTETPVSDSHGIPEAIFRGTAENLDPRNLTKFRKRMLGPQSNADIGKLADGCLPIEELKDELLSIADAGKPAHPSIRWARAYITSQDRIFPPSNQRQAWDAVCAEGRCRDTFILDSQHYVDLKTVVDSTIPDLKKVGKRFEDSSPTYDSNASAQTTIAERLTALLTQKNPHTGGRILEIGQGTGLFTRMYGPILKPAEAHFVDIYPTRHFGIAPAETYHTADAETWLERNVEKFDAILSASTIQWFRNPRLFFLNAARALRPDGTLVCSTYLPGTLGVFDSLRPSPMLYKEAEEIASYANENFGHVEISQQMIDLAFENAKEALLHLRQTGVGGAFGRFGSLRQVVKVLDSGKKPTILQFKALYIYSSHPKC